MIVIVLCIVAIALAVSAVVVTTMTLIRLRRTVDAATRPSSTRPAAPPWKARRGPGSTHSTAPEGSTNEHYE